ncbi:MAG: MarR family transcriptional regulator [Lactobacillus sp.]|jgi:DNA-binding MarR family transcriptional regulator
MGPRFEALQGGVHGQNRSLALLARNAHVRPSSVSEVLERLEKSGLIERRRDQKDRRVLRVYLTDKGSAQNESNSARWYRFVGHLMEPLSEAEKESYLQILQKLQSQADLLESRLEADAAKERKQSEQKQ